MVRFPNIAMSFALVNLSTSPSRAPGLRVLTATWVHRCFLALADQGFISGSNFLIGLLLARWLTTEQYGIYALAMSTYLLVASLQQALVLEPMTVLGPALHSHQLRRYVGGAIWLHGLLSLPVVALLAATSLVLVLRHGLHGLALCAAALGVATPLILLLNVARTASYLELRPGPATTSAVIYSVVLLGGVAWLYGVGLVSPASAILLMGTASTFVSVLLLLFLKPDLREWPLHRLRVIMHQHWSYGRWVMGVLIVGWVAQNISYALTGSLLSLKGVGALRALMNMVLPVGTLVAAVNRLTVPYLAGISNQNEPTEIRRAVLRITAMYASTGTVLLLVPALFHRQVFQLFYGGKYMEWSFLLPYIVLWVAGYATAQGFYAGFRALQHPSSVFVTECVAAAVFVLVGAPAAWSHGLSGIIAAGVVANLAMAAVAAVLFRRMVGAAA